MIAPNEIYTALSSNDELTQLLKKVDGITVISYDGTDATWCDALEKYLHKNDKSIECVKRIILFGLGGVKDTWKKLAGKVFSAAEIVSYNEAWKSVNPYDIHIDTPLVVHFTSAIGDYKTDFVDRTDRSLPLRRLVLLTRLLFSAVILGAENSLEIITHSKLPRKTPSIAAPERSLYCIEKENYIKQCKKDLSYHKALSICLEEVKHGCISCCMAENYGKVKHCPLAQHEVAQLYLEQNQHDACCLSHQLERLSAKQGYKLADIQIADNMALGKGCEKDIHAAISIYKRYAFRGDIYCTDKIVDIVYREDSLSNLVAVPWMIRQAINGNLKNADELSRVFTDGLYGVPIDTEYIEKLQDIFAESSDDIFINNLKIQAEERNDYKSVIKWSRKLRDIESNLFDESKHTEYLNNYINSLNLTPVRLYFRGHELITLKVLDLAEAYFIASAKEGYIPALERLCEEYYSGSNFKMNYQESAYWGEKALEQGSKNVRFRLAWLLDNQKGVTPNYEKAFHLYETLASEGSSAAWNNLGCMYARGTYTAVDKTKAFECFLKSAEAGDEVAMNNVGNKYRRGEGVDKNEQKAFEWYKKGAEKGYIDAISNLIDCYKEGIGVEKDEQKVIEWYEKIIEEGEKDEINNLGIFYENIIKDYEKACHYYRMAAEQGDEAGQYNLGTMYEYGLGVDEDENAAIYWYRKSARQGYEEAIEKLEDLEIDWLEENE